MDGGASVSWKLLGAARDQPHQLHFRAVPIQLASTSPGFFPFLSPLFVFLLERIRSPHSPQIQTALKEPPSCPWAQGLLPGLVPFLLSKLFYHRGDNLASGFSLSFSWPLSLSSPAPSPHVTASPDASRPRSVALSWSRRRAPPSPLRAPRLLAASPAPPLLGPLLLLPLLLPLLRAAASPAARSALHSSPDPQPWPTSRRASSPRTSRSDSTARRKRSAAGGRGWGRGRQAGAWPEGTGCSCAGPEPRGAARCGAGPGPGTLGRPALSSVTAARRDPGAAGSGSGGRSARDPQTLAPEAPDMSSPGAGPGLQLSWPQARQQK